MASKYTEERAKIVIDAIREGSTLVDAANLAGVSPDAVYDWEQKYPQFGASLSRARLISFDAEADELKTIADSCHDVHKARLKSDNIKWRLSRLVPHKYGDRLDVNVTHTADISKALETARARVLPARYPEDITDAQLVEPQALPEPQATGSEPVSVAADASNASEDLLK